MNRVSESSYFRFMEEQWCRATTPMKPIAVRDPEILTLLIQPLLEALVQRRRLGPQTMGVQQH